MKEARPEAEAGSHPLAIADHDADILQRAEVALVALDIGKKRAIIARMEAREMRSERSHERAAAGRREGLTVHRIGKELEATLFDERPFWRQLAALFVSGGQLARLDLARLDIRLVERV